jgi:hypothetical protein
MNKALLEAPSSEECVSAIFEISGTKKVLLVCATNYIAYG